MGEIISFFNEKHYGFIREDDGKTVFFHVSDVQCPVDNIKVGKSVVYALKEYTKKGEMKIKATHIQII